MAPKKLRNVLLRTKRQLGKRLWTTKMVRAKIVLKRRSTTERLGLGIGIETDDSTDRVVSVRIEQVESGSVAGRSGLEPGDRILHVDGHRLDKCSKAEVLALFQYAGLVINLMILPVQVVLERLKAEQVENVATERSEEQNRGTEKTGDCASNFHSLVGKFDASFRPDDPRSDFLTLDSAPVMPSPSPPMPDYEPVFQRDRSSSVFELIRQFDAKSIPDSSSVVTKTSPGPRIKATNAPIAVEESTVLPTRPPTLESLAERRRSYSIDRSPYLAAPASPTTSESSSGVHSLVSSTNDPHGRFLSPIDKEATRLLERKTANDEPTTEEIAEIRRFLGVDATNYSIFGVTLFRQRNYDSGSVGLILTSHPTSGHVLVQRVVTASIADKDDRLSPRDLIFFINDKFTGNVSINVVRDWLKSPSLHVKMIVGRLSSSVR